MLLLVVGLFVGSLLVLFIKRNWETLLLSGLYLSLTIFLVGVLFLMAKRGGIPQQLDSVLFLTSGMKTWMQYRPLTLNQLGYFLAMGRHLFPLLLLEMAMYYSMLPFVRKYPALSRIAILCPAISLYLYCPSVYREIIPMGEWQCALLYHFSYFWVVGYVLLAICLLSYELHSITMPFCRRQFAQTFLCLVSLSILYLLYCSQDPGQVYHFYSYDYRLIRGIGYLRYTLRIEWYIVLAVITLVCGVLGLVSLLRYTRNSYIYDRQEVGLDRKFDIARTGASIFVHSLKNQLLANRVLFKRLQAELQNEQPDLEHIRQCADSLRQNNELLISRTEELYRTVKSKSIRLSPVSLGRLEEITMDRFRKKYPEGLVEVSIEQEIQVLADENYFSEALYNLLINAWEAGIEAGHSDSPVKFLSYQARLYTVLEIQDCGSGISPLQMKRIFEPFYSSKNVNYNWGMGLYHTRTIIRSHLGLIRVENRPEGGASFLVLLPRYGK